MIKLIANTVFQPSQLVNIIGKYLYKHIDTAYHLTKAPNLTTVYFEISYRENISDDIEIMSLYAEVTTYQNKIRLNIIEITPAEKTLGHDTFSVEIFKDLNKGMQTVLSKLKNRIKKAFDYADIYF